MLSPDLLAQSDPELWNAIRLENQRQEDHVELIASENYVSRQVLIAQGSQLTNKYAEGYPGKRYYGGCEYVDMAESLAIERAMKLFGAPWANVQAHSGSQANQAVYTAVLKPGETILGMSLAHGGHLTHGSPVNLSGRLYRVVSYQLNEKEEIDYEQAERVADRIDAGMVYVNIVGADGAELPFGGTKRSGFGRELGRYGADEFVNKKLIRIS